MVVRHHQIDFASGALVFPGGKADEQDFAPELRALSIGGTHDENLFGAQVAALRESFEECGLLLAVDADSGAMIDAVRLAGLQKYRQPIVDSELGFVAFLTEQKLRLKCDLLSHFAHWITPEMMPKRFDTHFFLAPAPDDHLALHDGRESVDSVWIRPADAIAEAQAGKRTVIFPTLRNIEKLGRYASVAQALASVVDQVPVPVLPWLEKRDEGRVLCIPVEAGYDVCEQLMQPSNTP